MLKKRLQAVYDMIEENSIVADIGCDHAMLVCALVANKKCQKAYAMDVNEKPLKQALKTIEHYNLTNNVNAILSNGLAKITDDVDTVVICGMGFETCKMILENDFDKLKRYKKIIIQINRDVYKLREWINQNNFKITNEDIVIDHHYYQIIAIDPNLNANYTNLELNYGPILLNNKTDIFLKYLEHLKSKYFKIINKISDQTKQKEIQNKITEIENIISN